MYVIRYYRLILTTLFCFFTSAKALLATELGIATIHDGRPYILNITAGTFQHDAHSKLIEAGFRQISKQQREMTYSNGGQRVLLEINPNTENTIQRVNYTNSNSFTGSAIARLGSEFEILSSGSLKCREAIPYSMDCAYKIDNEHGKYNLIGVFQYGGIRYTLEGTPKFTVLTSIRSSISKPTIQHVSAFKQIDLQNFSFEGLYVGMKQSDADKLFKKLCTTAKPKINKQHWTCALRGKNTSRSLSLYFQETDILSKISLYMTFEGDPLVGRNVYEKQKGAFIDSLGENACTTSGYQSICDWEQGTRVARLKYTQGNSLQYSFEYK